MICVKLSECFISKLETTIACYVQRPLKYVNKIQNDLIVNSVK